MMCGWLLTWAFLCQGSEPSYTLSSPSHAWPLLSSASSSSSSSSSWILTQLQSQCVALKSIWNKWNLQSCCWAVVTSQACLAVKFFSWGLNYKRDWERPSCGAWIRKELLSISQGDDDDDDDDDVWSAVVYPISIQAVVLPTCSLQRLLNSLHLMRQWGEDDDAFVKNLMTLQLTGKTIMIAAMIGDQESMTLFTNQMQVQN